MPDLLAQIESRSATVGVVGLGYVGLPLVGAIHDAGFRVLGYDLDQAKIDSLCRGESYIKHLGDDFTLALSESDRFVATSDPTQLADADAILLCVPTPLGPHREPDLTYVIDSTRMVAQTLRPGQLIVLESTTYPGTTRDEMMPILEATGLTCGTDFFLAYSPEREDPGRADRSTRHIPKVVGGVDSLSTQLAVALYSRIVEIVHEVSSAEVAEASKLLENIYRSVNIAMVNEMKVLLSAMDIDVWEVIRAAATKPFGFQPFYPGPGLGGHCIPIDPFYLSWKAKSMGLRTKFIELAGEVNSSMPAYVIQRIAEALNDDGKALRASRVLIIGIAYKPNIDDIRESPAAAIITQLQERGAEVSYHDPLMPTFPGMRNYTIDLDSVELNPETLASADCVVIVTDHSDVNYDIIGQHAALVIDTRDAMADVIAPKAKIVKA